MSNAARKQEVVIEPLVYTTSQASLLIGKSVEAIRHAVRAGYLVPEGRGQRGRHKEHLFTRDALLAYVRGK